MSAKMRKLRKLDCNQQTVGAAIELTDEIKRQIFIKLRDENYLASLRLEGFDVDSDHAPVTLEALRSKYVR